MRTIILISAVLLTSCTPKNEITKGELLIMDMKEELGFIRGISYVIESYDENRGINVMQMKKEISKSKRKIDSLRVLVRKTP